LFHLSKIYPTCRRRTRLYVKALPCSSEAEAHYHSQLLASPQLQLRRTALALSRPLLHDL
jgi:hypothetical protein